MIAAISRLVLLTVLFLNLAVKSSDAFCIDKKMISALANLGSKPNSGTFQETNAPAPVQPRAPEARPLPTRPMQVQHLGDGVYAPEVFQAEEVQADYQASYRSSRQALSESIRESYRPKPVVIAPQSSASGSTSTPETNTENSPFKISKEQILGNILGGVSSGTSSCDQLCF